MPQSAIHSRDLIGSRIERFFIKARLGSGGMGEVFLAEDTVLRTLVAIKAIHPDHSHNPDFHRRLLREGQRASRVNDEHIARIYQFLEHDGRTFLIMEYVEGQSLRSRLTRPLATDEFFSLAEQCLAGLTAAHQRGILHCDLKPENIMVTPTGLVKILDFGLARPIVSKETRATLDSDSTPLGGTLAYMAPEVLAGREPDERADIFSLGVILYEALTGSYPFRSGWPPGTAGEPRPIRGPVLLGLDTVVLRMLAKDPAQRYQSCDAALADIRAVHQGRKPALSELDTACRSRFRSWLRIILPLAVALALGFGFAYRYIPGIRAPVDRWLFGPSTVLPLPDLRVLVVLPFRGSDDSRSRLFANGLSDMLAAKLLDLAHDHSLIVIAPSEVRAQKVTDAQQARKFLGATLVLEGSMYQYGNIDRVTYGLVDTKSLRQLRSGEVTADASNPIAVQDRVIEKVLSSLEFELTTSDRTRMESHETSRPEAYEAYLLGRGYLQGYDRADDQENAIAAFQRSLALDPEFALAYAGLGQAYMYRYAMSHSPDLLAQAKAACMRAVELKTDIPDGEICMGMLFDETGEYEQAARHLERAVELDGQRDESLRELAWAYEKLQRLNDAESLLKKAISLRPRYWGGYKYLGHFYDARGRYGEAIGQFQEVVKLAPDSYSGYSNLGGACLHQGDYDAAIAALKRSIEIHPTAPALSNLGIAYFYQRRFAEAARSYEAAAQLNDNRYEIFGNLAEAYGQIQGKEEESRSNYSRALVKAEQSLAVNRNDAQTLSSAAIYAARLGQRAQAERYRAQALVLSADAPDIRKNSALVLAWFHQDQRALAELDRAVSEGLRPSEITNDPAWRRFSANPLFRTIIAKAKSKQP